MKIGLSEMERGKIIEKFTGVFDCQVNSPEDYSLCEYYVDDGSFVHQEGDLLAHFDIALPMNLAELAECVFSWPVEKDFVLTARKYFLSIMNKEDNSSSFSDYDMLLSMPKEDCWVRVSSMTFNNSEKPVVGILFINVNEEKQKMLSLLNQASNDPLTGALNRSALVNAVNKLAQEGGSFAVIMLDVDGFKVINDTCGHMIGDSMLVDIVDKLRHGLRREDIIGRIGGDEFMICLRDVFDTAIIERLAKHICVLAHHSMPNGLSVSASLGISLSPRDGTQFEELYKKADIAMYSAKHNGGDTFVIYEPKLSRDPGTDSLEACCADYDRLDCGVLVEFKVLESKFIYPYIMTELFGDVFDNRPLWKIFEEEGISSFEAAEKMEKTVEELSFTLNSQVIFGEYFLRTVDGIWRWYRVGFVRSAYDCKLWLVFRDINEEIIANRRLRHISQYDELTGLLSHSAFNKAVETMMEKYPEAVERGECAVLFFDVARFKAINDLFGVSEGDRLLIYIADIIVGSLDLGFATRLGSDRFAVFIRKKNSDVEQFIDSFFESLANYDLPFEIVCSFGIYSVTDPKVPVDIMLDRAIIAQTPIKGCYNLRFNYYNEEMRKDMLGEQEIVGAMTTALAEGQFKIYYQPQYDHANGTLIGAEALVRWLHPERGIINPNAFIPIFEKNGFITKLDFYVFEGVCRFLSTCIANNIPSVPVSVNLTRFDFYEHDFVERLESIRRKYNVPAELIRIEITESAIFGSNRFISEMIEELHRVGYVVEMDDFGCGYSSLNVLKDINLDVIKLDMQFLSNEMGNNRGGTILGSVIRMAKWLNLTVIAEGVESKYQADYLNSIGCNYVQGFLYTKPVPEEEYLEKLIGSPTGEIAPQMTFIDNMNSLGFCDPQSQETLIFNNYVGAAALFDYHDGTAEIIRVNSKYLQELGGEITEKELFSTELMSTFCSEEDRWNYIGMIKRAIESDGEEECEVWRKVGCCERVFVRSTIRIIGNSDRNYIIYESIRNITKEKKSYDEMLHRENIFRAASEQLGIYYWEYDVATKEMRPCFRCMRDLRLPPLVQNYPEPAIEEGIFPQDYADMYREMHRKIEQGVKEQEAVIPLTAERVPFTVRYTVEFDKDGKPVKAYGSAAPV